jgi:hypothetical protein
MTELAEGKRFGKVHRPATKPADEYRDTLAWKGGAIDMDDYPDTEQAEGSAEAARELAFREWYEAYYTHEPPTAEWVMRHPWDAGYAAGEQARTEAVAQARAEERAAIVAWLNEEAHDGVNAWQQALEWAADRLTEGV